MHFNDLYEWLYRLFKLTSLGFFHMNILRFFLTFTRLLGVTYGTVKVNFIALNMTKLTLFCSADIENATSEKECAAACLNEDNDCSAFQFNETYCTCWKYVRQTRLSKPVKDLYIRDRENHFDACMCRASGALENLCKIEDYYNVLQLCSIFLLNV